MPYSPHASPRAAFGPSAEIYGAREEWLDLGPAPTAADVYQHYRQRDARIGELEKSLHIAVNQTIAARTRLFHLTTKSHSSTRLRRF